MTYSQISKYKFIDKTITAILDLFFTTVRYFIRKNSRGSIVIINLHKLGDSVCTIPSVRKISGYHNKKIFMVCFSETTQIFKLVLDNIEYLELSHSDFYLSERIASSEAKRKLKKCSPKIIYDLTGSSTSASLIFNSSAEKIIGINQRLYRKIFTTYVPIRKEPHLFDIYLDAVKNINYNSADYSESKFRLQKDGKILLHPFAGWKAKEWNLKKYFLLAERLNKRYKTAIIIPAQGLNKDSVEVLSKAGIEVIYTKTTNEMIEVLKTSFLLIGNDSGPVHVANLLGIPTFTIYGPSNPDYHKPLNGYNSYLIKEIKCSPKKGEKVCFTDGGRAGCSSFECMNLLTINEVEDAVLKFINNLIETEVKHYSEK